MVSINKNFSPEDNFWERNPQLIVMKPFSDLYNTDEGGVTSSKYGWMCFFMCHPDEDENKFYRIPEKARITMLTETYFKDMDLNFPEYLDCLSEYPDLCMSSTEKSIKKQKELIKRRDTFLDSLKYTLDTFEIIGGKTVVIPGTFKQIEAAHKATPSIYKMLKELEELYNKEKASGEIYGGRNETLAEKNLI